MEAAYTLAIRGNTASISSVTETGKRTRTGSPNRAFDERAETNLSGSDSYPRLPHPMASFFNFYIIFFPIYQKYMPKLFFCKNVILPPVHPAEGRYRRMNRRQVHRRIHTAGSTGGKVIVANFTGTVATYRQINRRYCSNSL